MTESYDHLRAKKQITLATSWGDITATIIPCCKAFRAATEEGTDYDGKGPLFKVAFGAGFTRWHIGMGLDHPLFCPFCSSILPIIHTEP